MFGFVSFCKYKKLSDLRNNEFERFSREIYELKMEIERNKKMADKYKKLYTDELQKRLEFSMLIKEIEGERE